MMRIEYSPVEHLLYLRLRDGEIAESYDIEDGAVADLGASGETVGLEFLDAGDFFAFLARRTGRSAGDITVDLPGGLESLVSGGAPQPASADDMAVESPDPTLVRR